MYIIINKLVLITNLMHNSFILQYMYYIKYLDMFRAIVYSSSGGPNCILQHLVSSLGRTVHRMRADCIPLSTGALHGLLQSDDIRCCKIQFGPPEDEQTIARNMSRHLM
jgi:hypothetical protein